MMTEKFNEDMGQAKEQCRRQDHLIIMGNFNAKVEEMEDQVVGPNGLGIRKMRGDKLHIVEWCHPRNLIIVDIQFQQPTRNKWTLKSPGGKSRNQIDYIMISTWFTKVLLSVMPYFRADSYSDHVLVATIFKLKLKKTRSTKITSNLICL